MTAFGIVPIAAALAINTLALVIACRYLYELGEDSIGAGLGTRAVLFLVLFPTAVFLVVPYSEALFLAGAVPSFLFARRGRWLPAGFAAAVAIGKPAARDLSRRRACGRVCTAKAVLASGVANPQSWHSRSRSFPFVLYGWYLWSTRGSPVYFMTAERLSWQRTFVGPVASFSNTIDNMLRSMHADPGRYGGVRQLWRIVKPVGEIIAMILAVVVTAWSLLRREWGWVTFVGLTVLALATSTYYYSVPRMLLSLFPVMLFLAAVTRSHRATYIALVSVSLIGLCFGTVLFTHRLWFY